MTASVFWGFQRGRHRDVFVGLDGLAGAIARGSARLITFITGIVEFRGFWDFHEDNPPRRQTAQTSVMMGMELEG
jgi:hypothetical protein